MPMDSKTGGQKKEVVKNTMTEKVDASTSVQKKTRKSLTSFSIFRRDKKFSESKNNATSSAVGKELTRQSTRSSLVLDNTRLEVGLREGGSC